MVIRTVKNIPVEGKRVLVRVDFNAPLTGDGQVGDDTKIKASIPTIEYLVERGAKVILVSHLGRPKGKVVESLRVGPVAKKLSQLLGRKVLRSHQVTGPEVEKMAESLPPGGILFLENVRFEPGEERNDPGFAAALARLADIFVNDAFGTVHRAHASNCGVASFLPSYAGLLMEKEVLYLSKARENPLRPLVAILGGSKVADKIGIIRLFLKQADSLLLGGAMANTFLKARGLDVGSSLYEEDKVELAGEFLAGPAKGGAEIVLPVDVVVAEKLLPGSPHKVVKVEEIPPGWKAVDIGPETVETFKNIIAGARMVIWNGPLGAYEVQPFDRGTEMIARALAESKAESIVGGGDIVAALERLGLSDKMTHLSTGGGATLDFWEGKELPGLAALLERNGKSKSGGEA